MDFMGSSGHVRFDANGERTDLSLQIRQLSRNGLVQSVGTWSAKTGLMWKGVDTEILGDESARTDAQIFLRNKKTFVVATVLVDLCDAD